MVQSTVYCITPEGAEHLLVPMLVLRNTNVFRWFPDILMAYRDERWNIWISICFRLSAMILECQVWRLILVTWGNHRCFFCGGSFNTAATPGVPNPPLHGKEAPFFGCGGAVLAHYRCRHLFPWMLFCGCGPHSWANDPGIRRCQADSGTRMASQTQEVWTKSRESQTGRQLEDGARGKRGNMKKYWYSQRK